jgi:ubiquinone/menaquinone biosynthesis C-methylase UbiE
MAGERSTPFDPQEWHNVQPPESMDISRRFEYDEDHLQLLRKWLRLDEPNTIVEIGCGSGFFTEKLAAMSPESEITGIEPDEFLRKYVEGKGIKRAKFIKGSAEEIPLPTGFADLTVCHIVLNNLPNVPMAVAEMARVTRDGGIVAAIEPIGRSVNYHPDPHLNELFEKAQKAFGRGIWELRSKEMYDRSPPRGWQARYPEIFRDCDLENVEVHGLLSTFLLSDSRWKREDIVSWMKERLDFEERDEERTRVVLKRGGMDDDTIEMVIRANSDYLRGLIDDPDRISETHELEVLGRIIIIGFKKSPHENPPNTN